MNYLFFLSERKPVIAHQWIILYHFFKLELKSDGTIFFFFTQQFKVGHLSIAYEIPTRHKRTTSN